MDGAAELTVQGESFCSCSRGVKKRVRARIVATKESATAGWSGIASFGAGRSEFGV